MRECGSVAGVVVASAAPFGDTIFEKELMVGISDAGRHIIALRYVLRKHVFEDVIVEMSEEAQTHIVSLPALGRS